MFGFRLVFADEPERVSLGTWPTTSGSPAGYVGWWHDEPFWRRYGTRDNVEHD